MPIQTILLGVIPPVVASAIVLLIAWRPWRSQVPVTRVGIGGSALALALAYALTDTLVTRSSPGFPPADLHRWLPWFAALAAVCVIALPIGSRVWIYDLVGIPCFVIMRWDQVFSKAMLPIIIPPYNVPLAIVGILWVLICIIMARWIRTDAVAVGTCGPRVPLVWMVAATGASFAFLQSSFDMLAQFAGSIAAVMGVFTLLSFWKPRLALVVGVAPVFALLFVSMTQAGASYVTIQTKLMLMLAAASHSLAGMGPLTRAPRWVGTLLSMLLAAAFSAAAIYYSPNGFSFGGY